MNVTIVVESAFGTTATVAETIAAGLRDGGAEVTVLAAENAPTEIVADLLVIGAPTHNLGLPSPRSREMAAKRGAQPPATGVAEWLERLVPLRGRPVVAFDTVVRGRFSGSAAKRIEKGARHAGGDVVARRSFIVAGSPPVLADGELDAARAWAAELG